MNIELDKAQGKKILLPICESMRIICVRILLVHYIVWAVTMAERLVIALFKEAKLFVAMPNDDYLLKDLNLFHSIRHDLLSASFLHKTRMQSYLGMKSKVKSINYGKDINKDIFDKNIFGQQRIFTRFMSHVSNNFLVS